MILPGGGGTHREPLVGGAGLKRGVLEVRGRLWEARLVGATVQVEVVGVQRRRYTPLGVLIGNVFRTVHDDPIAALAHCEVVVVGVAHLRPAVR